jgi:hypothetical protein
MDGEGTFSRQTMLGTARQVRKEAGLNQLMQPRRFDCKSTEDGARAHGAVRTAVGKRLPTRETDAWGRAPKPREDHDPRGSRHPEKGKPERRVKGTWQRMPGPAGTPGPIWDAMLSDRVGSAAEAQEDTTSEEKAAH